MTQDEIIEMTRQAGGFDATPEFLERFAKLVAIKEREACARVCENLPAPDMYSNTDMSMWDVTCIDCADAIRERGQA